MKRVIGAVSLLAAAAFWQTTGASAESIAFSDFSSTNGLELNGAAIKAEDALRLVPNAGGEIGSAFTSRKFVRTNQSFKSRFRFSIHDGTTTPAEGMAFVLQPGPANALGGSDLTALGYADINPGFAVEFDLVENLGGGDPSGNHVAIVRDGSAETHLVAQDARLLTRRRHPMGLDRVLSRQETDEGLCERLRPEARAGPNLARAEAQPCAGRQGAGRLYRRNRRDRERHLRHSELEAEVAPTAVVRG